MQVQIWVKGCIFRIGLPLVSLEGRILVLLFVLFSLFSFV